MQIHELTLSPRKQTKRIGRGGKRGTTAGRGTKGQGAKRKKKDPLFEGGRSTLIEMKKKNRGFKSPHPKKVTLSLKQIDARYADGEIVTIETLLVKRLITPRGAQAGVKVVATGKLSKKVSLGEGILVSEAAKGFFK